MSVAILPARAQLAHTRALLGASDRPGSASCWECARAVVYDAALQAWCVAPHVPAGVKSGAKRSELAVTLSHGAACVQCAQVTCGVGPCAWHVSSCITCGAPHCEACFVGPRGRRGETAHQACERLRGAAQQRDTPELRCWHCEARRLGPARAKDVLAHGLWVH